MKDIILKTGTYTNATTSKLTQRGAIPGASLEKFVTTLLKNPSCCAKYVVLTKGSVTQATSATTGVSIEYPGGKIVCFTSTLAAVSTSTFTVTNSFVKADSLVIATIQDYTGTTGLPTVTVDDLVAGSFKINLNNVHNAAALNGVVTIAFAIM